MAPYLYQAPTHQSQANSPTYDFDPKAVTRASWSTVAEPKPKQNGPYLNFNRHPDSYVVVPQVTPNIPVLPKRTKKTIIATRWIQFALRVVQLITALGLLVCVICIEGVSDVQSWLLRLPVAWDCVVSAYAIFHLLRPAKARTPMSSASYHTFALFMDFGLIPFMAVDAFFAENNWAAAAGTDGRWKSFFSPNENTSNAIFLASWILAIVLGALHLLSIPFDLYLVWIFRKIARYPADANPLEDNLTSRAASKHKYKNSDASLYVSERKAANMSGSTLYLSRPTSERFDNEKLIPDADVRQMPFGQSRVNLTSSSDATAARMSQLYQQSSSARNSRVSVGAHSAAASRSQSRSRSKSRPRSQGSRANSASPYRNSRLNVVTTHDPMPARPQSFAPGDDRPLSFNPPADRPLRQPSRFLAEQLAAQEAQTAQQPVKPSGQTSRPTSAPQSPQKEALLNDNWYVFADDEQSDLSSARRTPQPPAHASETDVETRRTPQSPVRVSENVHSRRNSEVAQLELSPQEDSDLLPKPLRMNPPSPPAHNTEPLYQDGPVEDNNEDYGHDGAFYFSDMPASALTLDSYGNSHGPSLPRSQGHLEEAEDAFYDASADNADAASAHNSIGTIGRALTDASAVSASSSLYSRENASAQVSRPASPKRKAYGDLAEATKSIRGFSPPAKTLSPSPSTKTMLSPPKQKHGRGKSHSRERSDEGQTLQRGHVEKGGRVVSRTGVDLADASVMYLDEPKVRGRHVSGKAAEEGRAGQKSGWWGGVRKREVSGTA